MLIEDILEKIKKHDYSSLECFRQVLGGAVITKSWIREHIPDPLPLDTYDRNLLHRSDNFEVVLATWPPGVFTKIHNHGVHSTTGLIRVICGTIFNRIYIPDGDGLKLRDSEIHLRNDFIEVPQGLVHAMGNPTDCEIGMTLHIYSPLIEDVTFWDECSLQPVAQVA